MRNRFRIFVALLFVGMACCLPAQAQQAAGQVERQQGTASRSTASTTSDLAQGSQVFVGDEISTGPGARILIVFDDESKLTMGENARITIDQFVYAPGGSSSQGRKFSQFSQSPAFHSLRASALVVVPGRPARSRILGAMLVTHQCNRRPGRMVPGPSRSV